MTAIEKVLLRKDAASLVVAIVLGTSVAYFLGGLIAPLATYISYSDQFQQPGAPVGSMILQAVISLAASLVTLELLIRLTIFVRGLLYKKGK